MLNKNEIKAGDESTNIQHSQNVAVTNTHNYGVSYSDVKDIAMDVFKNNFYQLSEEAANVAKMRAEEITEEFLKKVEKYIPENIQQMRDPGMQHALLTAQIEYAKTGDKDVSSVLLDILLRRIGEPDRNMQQIVLNEALTIVPKLTNKQLDILCMVIFITVMELTKIEDIQTLKNTINEYVSPIVPDLEKINLSSNLIHLEYSSCINITYISTRERKLMDFFRKIPNLFVKEKFMNFRDYVFVDEETENKLKELPDGAMLSDELIKKYLFYLSPEMEKLFDLWENTILENVRLTSVGMVLGNIILTNKTGLNIDITTLIE